MVLLLSYPYFYICIYYLYIYLCTYVFLCRIDKHCDPPTLLSDSLLPRFKYTKILYLYYAINLIPKYQIQQTSGIIIPRFDENQSFFLENFRHFFTFIVKIVCKLCYGLATMLCPCYFVT